jgi:hypothetical protein
MTLSRSFAGRHLLPLLALALALGSVSLQAGTVADITFTFSGVCDDCLGNGPNGQGTATLVLTDYIQGQEIQAGNLVSFTYDGSDVIPPFTISADDFQYGGYIQGIIPTGLPAYANFAIGSPYGPTFESNDSGSWRVMVASDIGSSGLWGGSSPTTGGAVPEPGAFLLTAGGIAAMCARRWRFRK